ncbi:MAG: DUF362 domain-containing protein [Deltaproteobacteria bacterium]|jgi:uncharacterized protein (DUF362 family)|nr:DUF362 domain-containing protein [Deltaproteobacteria bacterium]
MKHKVIIRKCGDYDADKIAGIIQEGMQELGAIPRGNILLTPNTVIAHPEIFPHAFTRKEFLDGVIAATKSLAENVKEIAVGERCGIVIPTRFSFKNAGYPEIIQKHGVKTHYFDEVKQVPVDIKGKENLRRRLFIPKPVVDADFLINLPKFKANPWSRMTLSLKNFIGIQDDRHRLVDHNQFLEHKIADLQEVIQPGFIAIDGIIAGQKMMLTPTPFPLGAIVMGTNSCAVDTVGCCMVHADPKEVVHLRLASERGFGPMDVSKIEILGDFPLEDVQAHTRGFAFCMEKIDDYFGDESNLSCTVGTFPEAHSREYCWGGCPGALQESMHIFRGLYPDVDKEMKKIRYVVGNVEGPLDVAEDERVIFAGNCTRWKGEIDGKKVTIEGQYKRPHEVDETKTRSNDMLLKTITALFKAYMNKGSRFLHIKGCTLSVAEHVNYLSAMAGIKNPHFDPRLSISLTFTYVQMRFKRFFNRLMGV